MMINQLVTIPLDRPCKPKNAQSSADKVLRRNSKGKGAGLMDHRQ